MNSNFPLDRIHLANYQISLENPESDGTLEWKHTNITVVSLKAGKQIGVGYTYSDPAAFHVIKDSLAPMIKKENAIDGIYLWKKMIDSVRNVGSRGIAASAISAVDTALWDLKAKLLNLPLCCLLGQYHQNMPVYGSGGFTSYSPNQLEKEFSDWKKQGIHMFKMKVGRHPEDDIERVAFARKVIGDSALFVDANGAYDCKEALDFAEKFHEYGVSWFEEPVSSDNLEGLNLLRKRAPSDMNIAAGEYGYELFYFRRMLEAGAVDVLQADATRCLGYTGFIQTSHLCSAFNIPLSSHTAPALHLPVCLSLPNICHMEYFQDHVRIEKELFDGFPKLVEGYLYPHMSRPGHGLELKEKEAKKYLIDEAIL